MSDKLKIVCKDNLAAPGGVVRGVVSWDCQKAPNSILLSLNWKTEGRGESDSGEVGERRFSCGGQVRGEFDFELEVPKDIPPSYSGQIVSIVWELHAQAEVSYMWSSDPRTKVPITISETGSALMPPNKIAEAIAKEKSK